ncbi:MAG: crotonase/enoyl-CoA hydratase family protein [Aquiluna sp.]|nr:crotonase/enoyl-CoA hydratase family protein [Aquiluna sp.]MCF8545679.1 crotonase/enoyl-CoA hydratase family protein [Aquiluna sp.]
MSESTKLTTQIQGHLLLIGLNRPEKRNAADLEMLHALSLAYGELDKNPDLRAGVIFAHGDHFTAGLDLADLGPKMAAGQLNMVPEGGLDPWGISTKQVSKPVVMAIQGTCFTLGVELALNSEVVIAADNAVFAQLEVSRGILPFGGGTIRFPRSAGWSNAMRYLLTGDSFDARTAKEIGLVTEVVPVGEELNRAIELANRIAAQAPLAVQATLASARNQDPEQEAQLLMQRLGKLMQTKDVARGMQAFMTKTAAEFEGN